MHGPWEIYGDNNRPQKEHQRLPYPQVDGCGGRGGTLPCPFPHMPSSPNINFQSAASLYRGNGYALRRAGHPFAKQLGTCVEVS